MTESISLTTAILLKLKPTGLSGRIRTHHCDDKPIGELQLGAAALAAQINEENRQKDLQVLEAIRAGDITVKDIARNVGRSASSAQNSLTRLMEDGEVTRYGAKSTGYFYQDATRNA